VLGRPRLRSWVALALFALLFFGPVGFLIWITSQL
jgi:hypothetical protein